ncbi:hypothetical protein Tco_1210223 [Tanacetum coccineum]
MLASPEQTATGKDLSNPFMVVMTYHGLLPFLGVTFQDTQTDCVQDTAQRMKLKRLKASTALMTRQTDAEQRRPTIKKLEVKQVEFKLGEDCWDIQDKRRCNMSYGSMRCGQYIAITDHILWDIITNGDQATTDPASSSAPKTSLAANARKKQREALNILLSVIGEAIFSVFHDAGRCKELYGSTLKPTYAVHLCLIHDDEDLLQIDEDAIEEIGIRWQVAMITARIRKFMRKTGRPIDLKPKNGITFDQNLLISRKQSKGSSGKEDLWPIEDPNSKALVATDNNEDIDWTKEFDAEPVTFAMMALTELKVDDWSMEFDAEHVHFGQDGLGDFDWSNIADDTPVSLALTGLKNSGSEILGYQMSLESLEVILKTHEKNEYAWGDKYEQMEYDLKMRDLKLEEKQKELDQVLKERDDFKDLGLNQSVNDLKRYFAKLQGCG